MAFCTNCGKELPEGQHFCTECGAPLGSEAMPAATAPMPEPVPDPVSQPVFATPQPTVPSASDVPEKGSKYAPITTWGYIGIFLLMCIPIIGLILMIVWACGGCRKVNKRNLARATLIFLIVGLFISGAFYFIFKDRIRDVMDQYGIPVGDVSALITQGGFGGNGALGGLVDGLVGSDAGDVLIDNSQEDGGAGIDDLEQGASQLQQDAEAQGQGWPDSLPRYPYGNATEVTSYRTEVTGSAKDEMLVYVDTLKANGYAFKDLYDFGFDEQTMIDDYNAWWATDGNLYLSISINEGVITIDYMDELPSLDNYF